MRNMHADTICNIRLSMATLLAMSLKELMLFDKYCNAARLFQVGGVFVWFAGLASSFAFGAEVV